MGRKKQPKSDASLLDVARFALHGLEQMSSRSFAHGGDKGIRDALEAAIAREETKHYAVRVTWTVGATLHVAARSLSEAKSAVEEALKTGAMDMEGWLPDRISALQVDRVDQQHPSGPCNTSSDCDAARLAAKGEW